MLPPLYARLTAHCLLLILSWQSPAMSFLMIIFDDQVNKEHVRCTAQHDTQKTRSVCHMHQTLCDRRGSLIEGSVQATLIMQRRTPPDSFGHEAQRRSQISKAHTSHIQTSMSLKRAPAGHQSNGHTVLPTSLVIQEAKDDWQPLAIFIKMLQLPNQTSSPHTPRAHSWLISSITDVLVPASSQTTSLPSLNRSKRFQVPLM